MIRLKISQIEVDGGTQTRDCTNRLAIQTYAESIKDGAQFPPVVAFYDGAKYWLADGFHRCAAYHVAGIREVDVDVHQGTRRDAILYSVGANSKHGIPRTNEDKRRAVETLLRDEEWGRWSNREIAKRACVSEGFVRKLRPDDHDSAPSNHLSLRTERSEPKTKKKYITKHGTEAVMKTGNIGKRDKPAEPELAVVTKDAKAETKTAVKVAAEPRLPESKPSATAPARPPVTVTAKEPEKPARTVLPYAAVADAVAAWSTDDIVSLMRTCQTLLAAKGKRTSLSIE